MLPQLNQNTIQAAAESHSVAVLVLRGRGMQWKKPWWTTESLYEGFLQSLLWTNTQRADGQHHWTTQTHKESERFNNRHWPSLLTHTHTHWGGTVEVGCSLTFDLYRLQNVFSDKTPIVRALSYSLHFSLTHTQRRALMCCQRSHPQVKLQVWEQWTSASSKPTAATENRTFLLNGFAA